MYVVAGATGRVGSATARNLLAAGAEVRVLVRGESAAQGWEEQGAEARCVDLEDRAALGEALKGCTGFFVLLPFDMTAEDLAVHADRLINSLAGAVADQKVPHVVMLSSGGADLAEGTGPIAGLHRMERALLATGTTLTALRSGHFQEKFTDVLDSVRGDGIYPVFAASADVPLPMVATADIGEAASRALQSPPERSETLDLIGPEYSERDVAIALGSALGRELQVVTIPEEAWGPTLINSGLPPHIAESLAELHRADEQGLLAPRGNRRIDVSTPVETTIAHVLSA
ncbi:NmrA family NAD(P)-binding protein [Nesterenkonia rhizosphaerae]|uniref:NAD(P)H-binding protein n=1 Tax=Nesterenkonia rhizosphaerae TaxID=1348272 RepID=A0ABP9G2H2_9MICC